jgi:hypothetical protein
MPEIKVHIRKSERVRILFLTAIIDFKAPQLIQRLKDLAVPQVPLDPLQILEHAPCAARTEARRPVRYDWGEQTGDCCGPVGTNRHRFDSGFSSKKGLSHAILTQRQGCQPVIINQRCFLG